MDFDPKDGGRYVASKNLNTCLYEATGCHFIVRFYRIIVTFSYFAALSRHSHSFLLSVGFSERTPPRPGLDPEDYKGFVFQQGER